MKKVSLLISMLMVIVHLSAQPIAITFQNAPSQGISITVLDSMYQSAIHTDSTKSVFTSEADQEKVYAEYVKLLQSLGDFLNENKFAWTKPTGCFNRIYFNRDGGIDYFVYNFRGKPEDKPSPEREIEFNRLLSLFIQDYKADLTADRPFAQCSPTTFMPKE